MLQARYRHRPESEALEAIADDLGSRIAAALLLSGLPALRRVSIEAQENTVTLRGELASYYQRQMAIALTEQVPGVARVVDLLRVR